MGNCLHRLLSILNITFLPLPLFCSHAHSSSLRLAQTTVSSSPSPKIPHSSLTPQSLCLSTELKIEGDYCFSFCKSCHRRHPRSSSSTLTTTISSLVPPRRCALLRLSLLGSTPSLLKFLRSASPLRPCCWLLVGISLPFSPIFPRFAGHQLHRFSRFTPTGPKHLRVTCFTWTGGRSGSQFNRLNQPVQSDFKNTLVNRTDNVKCSFSLHPAATF